jgi:hypothetical protein
VVHPWTLAAREWKAALKTLLGLTLGLLFNYFAGRIWSAWEETAAAAVLVMAVCFLAALALGVLGRKSGLLAGIAFAFSFLIWPLMNGWPVWGVEGLLFNGILEFSPAIFGASVGLALRRFGFRSWWYAAAAVLAVGLLLLGPHR